MCLVVLLAAGCSVRNRKQLEPERLLSDELAKVEGLTQAQPKVALPGPLPISSYRLTPGDQLQVHFPDLHEQDFTAVVRPDGFITSPRYGDLPAMGWTPSQLADSIRVAYGQEFLKPRATVQVTSFGPQFFYVFGEVRTPDRYEFEGPQELIGAITRAGGFLRSAVPANVVVLKVGPDGGYTFTIHDLNDIMENPAPPIWLESNNIVIIPKSTISNAADFVRDYVMTFIAPADAFLRGRYYWQLARNVNP